MAVANGLNPIFESIGFNGTTARITGGVGTDDTSIKAEKGTLPAGSLYLASDGKVWTMVTTTWTNLTIN